MSKIKTCCKNPKLTTLKDKAGNWYRVCSNCGNEEYINDVKESLQKIVDDFIKLNKQKNEKKP